jgi:hypothetical protein
VGITKAEIEYKFEGRRGYKKEIINLSFYNGFLQPITTAIKEHFQNLGLQVSTVKSSVYGFTVRYYAKGGVAKTISIRNTVRTF